MIKPRIRSSISSEALKKQTFQGIVAFLILAVILILFFVFFRARTQEAGQKKELLEFWEGGSYEAALIKSREGLAQKPMDDFYLTINGFAAYQMAVAQINNAGSLAYVDECIWSLRRALLGKNVDRDGRIRYVLGKAYYFKGSDYADLAVKYLESAKADAFSSGDLNEYLGLAYTALKNYRKSVEALTASLDPQEGEESDLLLMYIGQSYMGLEDWDSARAYLTRCAEKSRDTDIVLKANLMLGGVLRNSDHIEEAITVLESVLETGGENAEASYELGEIYASQGDTTRARAAWRRAYRADPNYAPVLARLNTM
jgi:tetratricopeptide (TPR) repeat protein